MYYLSVSQISSHWKYQAMFNKHFLFRTGIILGYVVLGCIILYFLFRGLVLDLIIRKVQAKLLAEYHLELLINQSNFNGLSTISFQGVKVSQSEKPALFVADSIRIEPGLIALLTGDVKIESFYLANSKFYLVCDSGLCNYSSLIKKKKPSEIKTVMAEVNYASLLNRVIRKVYNLAPQQAEVRNFQFEFKNDSIHERILIPSYVADQDKLDGIIQDENSGFQWSWSGAFSQEHETFDVTFYPLSATRHSLPILNSLFNIDCSFDTLHLALYDLQYENRELDITGHFSTQNLRIYHKRISQDTVKFVRLVFDSKISVAGNAIALDSASFIQLNSIPIRPYVRIQNGKSKVIDMQFHTNPIEATDFFFSLPEGMFEVVRDVEADGTLEYSLNFHLDSSQPESVVFNSALKKSRFHLTRYGDGNLAKIRGPFWHSVYENDRLSRSFEVGPGNPYYTSIDSISPLFQSAVLTSEDGNFYFHNGFNEDAFRKSIATNFRAGRFQRGGSTISMQLVKNVYLTRSKTVARKAEEALIVWLLESNRIVTKSRMFEVYLNIIELGPGIYGVGEAAEFYFSKHPSQLDLAESIFLANLLPHPKWYRSSFDEFGQLKPHLADYYRLVSNFMLKKNLITQEQFDQLKPQVILNGPAREKIVKSDSIAVPAKQ